MRIVAAWPGRGAHQTKLGSPGKGKTRPALAVLVMVLMLVPAAPAGTHQTEDAQRYPCRFAARYKFRHPDGSYSRALTRRTTHRRIHRKLERGLRHINIHRVLREKPFYLHDQIEALILCLFPKYGLPGYFAVQVGECESGLNPLAANDPYYGVYQHHASYWPERAATYGHAGASIHDAYAQVHVTAQMVRDGGWGPWSCA